MKTVAIIGAGPAGMMAAEMIAQAGQVVDVYDAMPSVGRKFLLAGIGGLNITHAEGFDAFASRYSSSSAQGTLRVKQWLDDFTPTQLRQWVHALGIETFVGTSQRVFPTEMKAAPLLRAWLARLRSQGVRFHARHRWLGFAASGALSFSSPSGAMQIQADATVLALGGASWQRLGSDGAWLPWLQARGVHVQPLQSANCGFDAQTPWSDVLREKFAGQPIKPVALHFTDAQGQSFVRQGEFVLTQTGVEGSLIYAASRQIRQTLASQGSAVIHLDLLPAFSFDKVLAEVAHPRGSKSLSAHLKSRLNLQGIKTALLYEVLNKSQMSDPTALATAIKALPIRLGAARPIDEAISSAGGVAFEALDEHLMLRTLPGMFCAGEMIDWEAPTGGYLLTACWASGRAAGLGVVRHLAS
ncbi:MAG: TIGR03862 family flavoprotein [Brachymonas sp.]